jgi:Flp pilus assembly pilin Flp
MSLSTLPRRRAQRTVAGPWPRGATRPQARPDRPGRWRRLLRDDAGMSTVEYAIGTIAAAAFAAVLYAVVSGDSVVTALTQLVQRALTVNF